MVRKSSSPPESQEESPVSVSWRPAMAPWSEVIESMPFSTGHCPLALCMAQCMPESRLMRRSFFSGASAVRPRGLGLV